MSENISDDPWDNPPKDIEARFYRKPVPAHRRDKERREAGARAVLEHEGIDALVARAAHYRAVIEELNEWIGRWCQLIAAAEGTIDGSHMPREDAHRILVGWATAGRLRAGFRSDGQRCGRCGGPHEFDTSVPSPLWNRVVRANGLPDTLCLSCVVWAFVAEGAGFEAELYGPTVDRPDGSVPLIRVAVDDRPIEDSYGNLDALAEEGDRDERYKVDRQRLLR